MDFIPITEGAGQDMLDALKCALGYLTDTEGTTSPTTDSAKGIVTTDDDGKTVQKNQGKQLLIEATGRQIANTLVDLASALNNFKATTESNISTEIQGRKDADDNIQDQINDLSSTVDSNYSNTVTKGSSTSSDNQDIYGTKTFKSTIVGDLKGNADTATSLATARTIQTNLASSDSASFDGSANVTPGVSGILPITNGGTGASGMGKGTEKALVYISEQLSGSGNGGKLNNASYTSSSQYVYCVPLCGVYLKICRLNLTSKISSDAAICVHDSNAIACWASCAVNNNLSNKNYPDVYAWINSSILNSEDDGGSENASISSSTSTGYPCFGIDNNSLYNGTTLFWISTIE